MSLSQIWIKKQTSIKCKHLSNPFTFVFERYENIFRRQTNFEGCKNCYYTTTERNILSCIHERTFFLIHMDVGRLKSYLASLKLEMDVAYCLNTK